MQAYFEIGIQKVLFWIFINKIPQRETIIQKYVEENCQLREQLNAKDSTIAKLRAQLKNIFTITNTNPRDLANVKISRSYCKQISKFNGTPLMKPMVPSSKKIIKTGIYKCDTCKPTTVLVSKSEGLPVVESLFLGKEGKLSILLMGIHN